jgi:hypothetical protein
MNDHLTEPKVWNPETLEFEGGWVNISAYRDAVDSQLELQRVRLTDNIQKHTLTALRALISEGTLTKTEALETYNTIADHNGWANIEAITSTYTVEVCYNGDIVLTVSGVEADTEEEATAEVLENLEVDNVRVKFDVSYGDYADEADVWIYDFDPTEDLSAVATEEYN